MKKAAGDTECMKTATGKVRWYDAKHREDVWVCFQEMYLCIGRATVNEK